MEPARLRLVYKVNNLVRIFIKYTIRLYSCVSIKNNKWTSI